MNVFVAGATGALGLPTVQALLAAGHRVRGTARGEEKAARLRALGAEAVSVDLFDARALAETVAGSEAVLHLATKILRRRGHGCCRGASSWRTDRLRSEASALLVDAALTAQARVYVQESITFPYADAGEEWLDEKANLQPIRSCSPLWTPSERRRALHRIRPPRNLPALRWYFMLPTHARRATKLRWPATGFSRYSARARASSPPSMSTMGPSPPSPRWTRRRERTTSPTTSRSGFASTPRRWQMRSDLGGRCVFRRGGAPSAGAVGRGTSGARNASPSSVQRHNGMGSASRQRSRGLAIDRCRHAHGLTRSRASS